MKTASVSLIMTSNVVSVSPLQKIIDVKHIYEKDKFHRHIPVVDNGKIVGMVSFVDFMYNIKGAGLDDGTKIYNELIVKDVMSSNPFFLNPNATIEEVANVFLKGDFHAIPIVDNDKIVGIVTPIDLIKFFIKE